MTQRYSVVTSEGRRGYPGRQAAMEAAQRWVLRTEGNARVEDTRGKAVMMYFWQGKGFGLGWIEY